MQITIAAKIGVMLKMEAAPKVHTGFFLFSKNRGRKTDPADRELHYWNVNNGVCHEKKNNVSGMKNGVCPYFLTSGQTTDMHVLEGLHIEIDGIPDDATAVTMNSGNQWLGARLKDASGCLECQIPVTITLFDAFGSIVHQVEIWNWDFGHEFNLPEAGNYELVISAYLMEFPDSELQNTYLVRTLQITAE